MKSRYTSYIHSYDYIQTMDFFFEIYSEEIPALMQEGAQQQLQTLLEKLCGSEATIGTYITPQRLVGHVTNFPDVFPESIVWIRGPRENAPIIAIEKFCSMHQITPSDLVVKNEYWYFQKIEPSQETKPLIPDFMNTILSEISWPKTMHWPQATMRWVRPIRAVMVVCNGEPLIFDIPQLGIRTTSTTLGHRFLAPYSFESKTFEEYKAQLYQHYVVLDSKERRNIIQEHLQGALIDEDLMKENIGLTEWPVVRKGNIAPEFMTLPKVVLRTVMKVHQKYFFFEDAPCFSVVCNTTSDNVMYGYERVLRARLSDARFFYNEDLKNNLKSLDLSKVIFYKGLGSFKDKIVRLLTLAQTDDERLLIELCKQDLVTQMVFEFPELNGIMGHIYAKAQGYPALISEAIEDHIRLDPQTELGAKIALLDHIDSLIGLLGAGVKVSGSKDPFALRRKALIIIRIYERFPYFESLESLLQKSLLSYKGLFGVDILKSAQDFIESRVKALYDFQAVQMTQGLYPFNMWVEKARNIQIFLESQAGLEFIQTYKRLSGLVKVGSIQESSFMTSDHPSESFLQNVEITLDNLTEAAQHIECFLNDITVNEGPAEIVASRQSLLWRVKENISKVANFSLIR